MATIECAGCSKQNRAHLIKCPDCGTLVSYSQQQKQTDSIEQDTQTMREFRESKLSEYEFESLIARRSIA